MLPGTGGTQRLARLVGKARAIELIVEGLNLPVEEAHSAGLVHKVWETETHDGFMRKVIDYAHEFCPPGRAAMAVGRAKRAIQSGAEMGLEGGLALERELQQELFCSQDSREGLLAFTQKRKPSFRGR